MFQFVWFKGLKNFIKKKNKTKILNYLFYMIKMTCQNSFVVT